MFGLRFVDGRVEFACGCSLLDRLRLLFKRSPDFPKTLKGFKNVGGKAVQLRGKREKELVEQTFWWGNHVKDPQAISSSGDTLVLTQRSTNRFIVYVTTIRREYERQI